MTNNNANKLVITGDNYKKFIEENIIDDSIDFSVVVPIPDKYKEGHLKKLVYAYQEDPDVLYLQFHLNENSFEFKTTYGIVFQYTDFNYPDSFYYWSLNNWSTPSVKPKATLEYIDNGVIIRFITLESSPTMWALKLNESYPDLKFDFWSIGARGHVTNIFTQDNSNMSLAVLDLSSEYLNKTDCYLSTKTLDTLAESLS